MHRIAYIVDCGFFTKKFKLINGKFPSANEVETYIVSIQTYIQKKYVSGPSEIYRIFFYDCPPFEKKLTNPIDQSILDLSQTKSFKDNKKLQNSLKQKAYFALRLGQLNLSGNEWEQWNVGKWKMPDLVKRKIKPKDLYPSLQQKGVDMRMGLDIASITSKRLCTKLVLLSGDTDMIPAMKMARKEGVHVFLHTFDQGVSSLMASHSDVIIKHQDLKSD